MNIKYYKQIIQITIDAWFNLRSIFIFIKTFLNNFCFPVNSQWIKPIFCTFWLSSWPYLSQPREIREFLNVLYYYYEIFTFDFFLKELSIEYTKCIWKINEWLLFNILYFTLLRMYWSLNTIIQIKVL